MSPLKLQLVVRVLLDDGEIGLKRWVIETLNLQVFLRVKIAVRAVNTAKGQIHGVLGSVHDFGGGQLLQGGLVEMQILCVHLVCDIVFVVALHVPREELSQQPKTLLGLRLARVKL